MIKSFQEYAPNLAHCWLLLIASMVGQVVVGLTIRNVPHGVVYAVAMAFPIALAFVLSTLRRDEGLQHFHSPKMGPRVTTLFFLITVFLTLCIIFIIDPLTSFIPMPDMVKAMFEQAFYGTTPADLLITTCILAPFAEEFLCRGIMMRGLCRTMSPKAAILWSAALFAIMHANPWQAIPAFILGAFFGWVYFKTGCLWVSIALHSLNNLVSSLLAILLPNIGVDQGFMDIMGSTGYWCIFGVTLGALILLIRLLKVLLEYEKIVSTEVRSDS